MRMWTLLAIFCSAAALQSSRADDQSTLAALRAACAADAQKFCSGVQPGGGRIVACLKAHKDELSDQCKQAAAAAAGSANGPVPGAPSPGGANTSGASGGSSTGSAGFPQAVEGCADVPSGAAAGSSDLAAVPKGKAAAAKGDMVIGGEKFVERVFPDPDHEGMRAATVHLPEKWHLESSIKWHYNWTEYPLTVCAHAENPANAEAYFLYPLQRLEVIDMPAQLRRYTKGPQSKPGDRLTLGAIWSPVQPPMQAMGNLIRTVRANVTDLKWLGQQDLPDLAKDLKLDPWPNDHGVAIKIGYDLNGQPVEEAFFGVYYVSSQGSDAGSAGQMHTSSGGIQQTNWGFRALQSFRAPAGTLDKRMPVFTAIAKSFYVNPEWGRLAKAINDKMLADFNQKLKAGFDQIRAAQAMMEQTMKQQAAFQANFDRQEAAFRNSGGVDDSYLRDGGARSAADHWDDLIRGVDTVVDPGTGNTVQLTNQGQYHFADGFGNYRTSDDPNYTPEKAGEVGSWTQMSIAP